jgi:hypothetical protein
MAIRFLVLALALVCATSNGAEERKDEKPTGQPPPEAAESAPSPLAAVDVVLRSSFKEYVGLSLDAKGTVFLTLSRGADLDATANLARETWMKASGRELREYLPHFDFVEAVATPEELHSAFARMRGVLTLEDVVSVDMDEACGCISVGVARDSAYERVAYFAGKQGISKTWIRTVITPPTIRLLDLQDRYRPTMGGVEIQFRIDANFIGICSLGLPTYSFSTGTRGFLTASHCTGGVQGKMNGTELFQGSFTAADKIGVEKLDMDLFVDTPTTPCPANRQCRFSDAAFIEYSQQNLGITGRITRPKDMCTGSTACALDVERATDDIRMVYGAQGLFVGTTVDKVGRTSGWTSGAITKTCEDVKVFDEDAMGNAVDTMITLLCQTRVSMFSDHGDSGAPVFEFHSTYGAGAFAGILWGGDGSSTSFSPIDGIQQDLGGFVFNQAGMSGTFYSSGQFYTSNVDDTLSALIERNVVPAGEIQIVLKAGANVVDRKEIVLVENPAAGSGRWTIAVDRNIRSADNGLYLYQLPGGLLEFRKSINGAMSEVSRLPIDNLPGGTRVTFTWTDD